eukprot:sb/3466374/
MSRVGCHASNLDSSVDGVLKYKVAQSCVSNYVINEAVFKIYNSFNNISSYHLENVAIQKTLKGPEETDIVATWTKLTDESSGDYYHLCGVTYVLMKDGKSTEITEYLFLPFTINVIDLVTVGEFTQSRGQDSWVFFNVTSLDDRVESVSLTYEGETVKVNVSTMDTMLNDTGPSDTNITVHRTDSTMLVYVTVPENQDKDSEVKIQWDIGSIPDTFTRTAKLGDYYKYDLEDITYASGEDVEVQLKLHSIPSKEATFALTKPFNARNSKFEMATKYIATGKKNDLGISLWDCTVTLSSSPAVLDMAGQYTVTATIPASGNYKEFQIDSTIGLTLVGKCSQHH